MKQFAYWVSLIFGTPIHAVIILVCLHYTGLNHHQYILFAYLMGFLQAIFPVTYLLWAIHTRRIKDIDVTKREERFQMLTLMFVGDTITLAATWMYGTPELFHIFLGVYVVYTTVYLINFMWKISRHMMLNTVMIVLLGVLVGPQWWLAACVLPVIAWSRIVLHKHTPAQLIAGTFIPGAMLIGMYSYSGLI